MNNDVEWWIAIRTWFVNQPIIALFGMGFSWYALVTAIYMWAHEDQVPDMEMAKGGINWFRGLWLMSIGLTA